MQFSSIIVLVLVLVACSKEDDDMIRKMIANTGNCVKESHVDASLVAKLKNHEFTDDENLKCFLKCVYVKSGVMSESGEFNVEELKKTLEEGKDVKIIDKCKEMKGVDVCDTVFLVARCTGTS